MRRRAFLVLSSGSALAACATATTGPAQPYTLSGPQPPPAVAARPVSALLPLTGPRSDIGQPMLQAIRLALSASGAPAVEPGDTAGTPSGATGAFSAARVRGVAMVLGPLTAPETDAVAPLAVAANVPVLAFTNTATAARPGVWTLGITPTQQVDRLVRYARAQGRSRFAALPPDNGFGHAMAQALTQAVSRLGNAPPVIRFHGRGADATGAALRDLLGGAAPGFDVLLLADTGPALADVASALQTASISQPVVQLIGPALWAAPASQASQVTGAWYAAPDPAARAGFVQAFSARYGTPPPGPADLAYDAASIARVLAGQNDATAALTSQAGFAGVDGWLRLLPDGRVERGLAVFQVAGEGGRIISPAPTTASAYAA